MFDTHNFDDFWGFEKELQRVWKELGYEIDTDIKPGKCSFVESMQALSYSQAFDVVEKLFNTRCRNELVCQWCDKKLKSKSGLTLHEKSCEFNTKFD